MILHEMEVTSVEVDLINRCNFQQFPHVVEECLNMYIHSDFSLNPLVVGVQQFALSFLSFPLGPDFLDSHLLSL